MKHILACIVFLILWAVSLFIGSGVSALQASIGMFSCLIMAKLDDMHRDILREREDGEEQ